MNIRTTETKCLFHKICCPEVFMPNKFIGHQMNGSKRTLATLGHCWCLMQANKVFQLCDGTDRWMARQQTYTLCFLMLRMQPKCKYQLKYDDKWNKWQSWVHFCIHCYIQHIRPIDDSSYKACLPCAGIHLTCYVKKCILWLVSQLRAIRTKMMYKLKNKTSLCSASYISWQRDTARICW